LVDHVNDSIGATNVGGTNSGSVDHDTSANRDVDGGGGTEEGGKHLSIIETNGEVGRANHVVREDLGKGGRLSEESADDTRRESGKGSVSGSEDGEGVGTVGS
jgi:hypothetical protein